MIGGMNCSCEPHDGHHELCLYACHAKRPGMVMSPGRFAEVSAALAENPDIGPNVFRGYTNFGPTDDAQSYLRNRGKS